MFGQVTVAVAADSSSDSEAPSYVQNLEAFPGDGKATLTWDPATDDTGVAGYYVYSGLSSVSSDGGSYTFGSKDVGDVTTYVMNNLSNGVTYYFSVTAYDAAGNESDNYSQEVEVTPEESTTGDFTAPTVSDAEALTSTLVEVTFSEDVVLPSDAAGAFSIEASDGTAIEVLDAYLSDDDSVVFVLTDEQTAGAQYILTASSSIADTAGNPIVSGTTDTAVFTGSAVAEVADAVTDTTDSSASTEKDSSTATTDDNFTLEDIEAVDANELVLTFSDDVQVADPDSFVIELADNALITVDVLAVSIDDKDASEVTLVTDDMDAGYDYVLSIDEGVLNKDGNALAEDGREMDFGAYTEEIADLIPPEDITNLLASLASETSVMLNWTASVDSAGDLAQYLVYTSSDGGTNYGYAIYVDKDATEQEVTDLTAGETYTFKVAAVDENGNESDGTVVTMTLPEAGPGMIGLFGLSLLGASVINRRRRA